MPGILPLLALALVAAIVAWFVAWRHTRSHYDPREEYRRLQRHAAWLENRLDQARREKWGAEMITRLSQQLGDACQKLGRARGGVIHRKRTRVR